MILAIDKMIADAVATIEDTTYLRASDLVANTDISEIDLSGKTFVMFENMPRIRSTVGAGIVARVPVVVRFMELDELTSTTGQGDEIRDRQITNAQNVFNRILLNDTFARIQYPQDMVIDLGGNLKLYDKIMTGVSLEFDVYINSTNLC